VCKKNIKLYYFYLWWPQHVDFLSLQLNTIFSSLISLQVTVGGGGHRLVSYAYFSAFVSLLNNMELVKKLYLAVTRGNRHAEVTKGKNNIILYFSCTLLVYHLIISLKIWNLSLHSGTLSRSIRLYSYSLMFSVWWSMLIFIVFYDYFILCNTLKLKGTNYPFKWIKVPGTGPYWKACMGFHIFKLIIIWYTNSVQEKYKIILFYLFTCTFVMLCI
jgi:hypothetical protein